MMPPVMAAFARRLDDRKIPKIRADLGLGWSGKAGETAWCQWGNGLVVLANNHLEIGGREIALEHIQGELGKLRGVFNGQALEMTGEIALASVSLLGQQLTRVAGQMYVDKQGKAGVILNQGAILGGTMAGQISSTLDATPRYDIELQVNNAELGEYAKTLPGHQTFKGRVSGQTRLNGFGYDLRSLNGSGSAKVADGDLGTLPPILRLGNILKVAENKKTAFDAAEVDARITNGETTLKPVRLIGNTISLDGGGTLDVRGILNVKLEVVPGRDTRQFPLFNDLTREFGGLFGAVRVEGPIVSPSSRLEAVPIVGASLRGPSRLRFPRTPPTDSPVRSAQDRKPGTGIH